MEAINNIVNNNCSIQEKRQHLFQLHRNALAIRNPDIRKNAMKKIFQAVRIVDHERYERQRLEEIRKEEEQRKMEEEMSKFNMFEYLCPKEDFPEFYIEPEQIQEEIIDIDMEDLTEQMEELTLDLKKYKVKELKKIAKNNNLKGYSKLRKKELVDLLNGIENLKLSN